ncbi:MAG: ABC transporter permease [Trueperaceae bacterium]|nr:ABC transporter permease [Trueperaceae bacterium]
MTSRNYRAGLWTQVSAMARKELFQIRRDPVLPPLIIIFPLALLLLFGFALNTSVKNIRLAVLDHSQDRISEAMQNAFSDEERFKIIPVETYTDAQALMDSAEARAILEIPEGALAAARNGESVGFKLYIDGSDPSLSAQIRAATNAAVQDLSSKLVAGRSLTGSGFIPPVKPTIEVLYNPDNRTAVYMVPGLIGLILTIVACLLTSLAIVRERELGTMEALIATPVSPLAVVLGKVAPYFILGLIDSVIVVTAGVLIFKVPIEGSLLLLALAIILFILGSLGVGIVISTLARTQVQAVFGTIAYFFPSIFLSGFLFPLDGFNAFFSALSHVIPLRYFMAIARGIMLRGAGLASLEMEFIALAIFCVVMIALASFRFRKTL